MLLDQQAEEARILAEEEAFRIAEE